MTKSFTKQEVEKKNKSKSKYKKKYFRRVQGEKSNIRIRGQLKKTRGWSAKEVENDISKRTSDN